MSAEVQYKTAERWIECHDCACYIRPGHQYARWREYVYQGLFKPYTVWRSYCLGCGPLLEQSCEPSGSTS